MTRERKHIPNVVWRGRWAHLRIRINRRQIWRSLRTQNATEARRRAAQAITRLLGAENPWTEPRASTGLSGLVTRFCEERLPELKPLTARDHRNRLERFLKWADGEGIQTAEAVTPETVLRFRRDRLAKVKGATVRSDLSAVRSLFNYARRAGWIAVHPFRDLPRGPRVARTERHIYTMKELRRVLVKAGRWRRAIALAAYAGLRRAEIANLRYEDLDPARGLIHVVNRPPEFTVKTYEARSVPLAKALRTMLKRKTGRVAPKVGLHVLSREVVKVFDAAKVPGGLHALRHNWITYLLLAGFPLARVMAWAGHANLSTTQGYLHVRQAVSRRDIEAFRKAFGYDL